jgi:hypothetical protein
MVTKSEFPMVDRDNAIPPQAQEIEYALILSRMISLVESDPSQMRSMIYEFARARLKIDMARSLDISRAGDADRKRLSAALEAAIQGVEGFTRRHDMREGFAPLPSRAIVPQPPPPTTPSSMVPVYEVEPTIYEVEAKPGLVRGVYPSPIPPILDMRARVLWSPLAKAALAALFLGLVAVLAIYRQRVPELLAGVGPSREITAAANPISPPQDAVKPKTMASVSLPLPRDYGIYAISKGSLMELHLLGTQVPDKRIAMSTPLSEPSRTVLPDGKPKFVIYRRDLMNSAPDRIDVRVVARVTRAIKFDAAGKPVFSQVTDAWSIRNQSYDLRVRPMEGSSEMMLVQAEDPDFVLPAGRYVLVLKSEGYDFTVAGNVTDSSQCLERTEAANGVFYSACDKQADPKGH